MQLIQLSLFNYALPTLRYFNEPNTVIAMVVFADSVCATREVNWTVNSCHVSNGIFLPSAMRARAEPGWLEGMNGLSVLAYEVRLGMRVRVRTPIPSMDVASSR